MDSQWERVEALLKPHFARVNTSDVPARVPGSPPVDPSTIEIWTLQVTPPCPSTWPVEADTPLTYYAYASSLRPGRLLDAQYVAEPWGMVVAAAGLLTFTQLSERLVPSGIESTYPPRPALIKVVETVRRDGPIERLLIEAARDAVVTSLIRQYYCHWCHWSGSPVGRAVLPRHPEFAKVLDCASLQQ
jgi:hypothetical protein